MDKISLTAWCDEKGISKQWAAKLCRDGRIEGAEIVDGYRWMVPGDARIPARLPNAHVVRAMERREAKRADKEQRDMARLAGDAEREAAFEARRKVIDLHVDAGHYISPKGVIYEEVAEGGQLVPSGKRYRQIGQMDAWGKDEVAYYRVSEGIMTP